MLATLFSFYPEKQVLRFAQDDTQEKQMLIPSAAEAVFVLSPDGWAEAQPFQQQQQIPAG